MWGGATFDVCMRFLNENPWQRLEQLRKAIPNILFQMLIRGSNAVGYKAYPDNLISKFISTSWEAGIDLFRVFDSLNWMEAMDPSIKHIRKNTRALAEVSMSYTGDILDVKRTKYNLDYYLNLAKDIENAGAHILAIKDMAGLLKPYAASELILALKDQVKIPIHLHTHNTSGIQAATYLKAIEAGVDVVDVALGGLSDLTSQPNFNSLVEMMRYHEREQNFDHQKLEQLSNYWGTIREYYLPFESGLRSGTASVYQHEIPGGQYSNLRPQANALGLGDRFDEIIKMYESVNELFGDLIKVTPSSKVVGDMALYMVTNNLTITDVLERGEEISFPESVQSFFRGDLGQPYGGFPKKLQKIILKDVEPYSHRPNELLDPIDFDLEFASFKEKYGKIVVRELQIQDLLSYLLYPKVWDDYIHKTARFGAMDFIPTKQFYYGLELNEETIIRIEDGKSLLVKLLSIGNPDEQGNRIVFFKINGQNRFVSINDRSLQLESSDNPKKDPDNPEHIGSPLQGMLATIFVKKGQKIAKNEPLFIIEAMKMETTITAPFDGSIEDVVLTKKTILKADDLVLVLKQD
jgi:pyruvate carboxylase